MKKATGSIIAIMLMISIFAMNVSATSMKSSDVLKELKSTAEYLTTVVLQGNQDTLFANDRTIIAILKSEIKNEKLNEAYVASLKKSLDANQGKLMYQGKESAGSYSGAITILQLMGKDPTSFGEYDLVKNFNNLAKTEIAGQSNPYMLAYTLDFVTNNIDIVLDKTVATELVSSLKKIYKEDAKYGNGYDYWGISVDTSATVATPLWAYIEKDAELKNQVKKTFDWIVEQYTPTGFNYSIQYPGINGNSTGLALFALSETGDMENAEKAYNALGNFKSTKVDGAYGYNDKTANVGATVNVITGLASYYATLKNSEKPEETTTQVTTQATTTAETTTQPTTAVSSTTVVNTTKNSKDNVGTKVPKTGTSVSPIALVVSLAMATGVIVVARKKSRV